MSEQYFALHGAIAYSKDKDHLITKSDAYVICQDGVCQGVFEELPDMYGDIEVIDLWDKLIIPGMADLMSRAASYQIRGMKMNAAYTSYMNALEAEKELYREGAVHSDLAYDFFAEELYLGATTRSAVGGCDNAPVDDSLMERIDQTGIISCMGSVDENRLFRGEYESDIYAPAKELSDELLDAVRENEDFLIQCPSDELNFPDALSLSPMRVWLDAGLNVGLGSGLGDDMSMLKVVKAAIQVSKLRCATGHPEEKPLSFEEAFYIATKGGGSYFGACGSFEEGYQFDAVILDDNEPMTIKEPSVRDRLERMVYLSDERNVSGKYVLGEKLY